MALIRPDDCRYQWIDAMSRVDRKDWDSLARPLATPLLEYDWLDLLERSESIASPTGWQPSHLTVWAGQALVAAAPLYIKAHSEGEFVFDRPWAELARSAGISYYPKLVGMSPASPVSGYRFLMDSRIDAAAVTARMLDEIELFARTQGLSGCHFLFVDSDWQSLPAARGYHRWHHPRFLWRNREYTTFEDYLAPFAAGQRRNIRRERRAVAARGISVVPCSGEDAPGHYFDAMHRYYLATNDKFGPWGCRYLTEAFFRGLAERCRRHLLFMAAHEAGDLANPLAMALLLAKGEGLLGRYWGARRPVPELHFETCYYRPIQWAIETGRGWFDPGMGGEHKLRRGFAADAAVSLHRFFDPRLQRVFVLSMGEINPLTDRHIRDMNRAVPFAKQFAG